MSIEINALIICDGGCGAFVSGKTGFRATRAAEPYWSAKSKAEQAGWIILNHGRYYPNRHFCPKCQDKPLPKLNALKPRPPQNPPCKMIGFD